MALPLLALSSSLDCVKPETSLSMDEERPRVLSGGVPKAGWREVEKGENWWAGATAGGAAGGGIEVTAGAHIGWVA